MLQDDKGWIPIDAIHKICDNFEIQAQKEMLEEFMKHSGIMDCNCHVDYEKFSKLINLKYQLPAINKIDGKSYLTQGITKKIVQ